ncbi:MAG: hypothetical protein LBQ66_05130, partial [Planctomycetaceae bacterium]|nr:hypothetical protein [Planctomycetaceae bacterium]
MSEKQIRFFNTTGPCNPEDHYMLPPAERLQGAQLNRYIKNKLYWVLHAPRQTGKTTFLQAWSRELNSSDNVAACYVSIERCNGLNKIEDAMPNLCKAITFYAEQDKLPVPNMPERDYASMLSDILFNWSTLIAPKQLVILFDEVDCIEGEVMLSFLRQLRGGFAKRGIGSFPTSIALVGMYDLKDYLVTTKDGKPLNTGSPFNIKEDSVSIANFSKEDIIRLFAQRTA